MQLMTRISKEQTVRYVLTLVDDMLVESDSRCKLFYSINASRRLSMWTGFMNMLNREDLFIVHQVVFFISFTYQYFFNLTNL